MKEVAVAFFLSGLLLGGNVRFPTFALVTVAALGAFAAFNWSALSVVELLYRLGVVAVALQVGYFAAVAAWIAFERRRRKIARPKHLGGDQKTEMRRRK